MQTFGGKKKKIILKWNEMQIMKLYSTIIEWTCYSLIIFAKVRL